MSWVSLFLKIMEAVTLYLAWRYDPKNLEKQEALKEKLKSEDDRRELDAAIVESTLSFNVWLTLILRELRSQKNPRDREGGRRDILGHKLPTGNQETDRGEGTP